MLVPTYCPKFLPPGSANGNLSTHSRLPSSHSISASRFHRGPRPGRRKKCRPSLKTPRAFMFFSVLDLTLSNSAASKVVRYSTTSTPPRRQKEERKGGDPRARDGSPILSQNGGSGSREATASSISHTSTCSADGAPRNWTRLATISVRYCLRPSTLASYSRVRSRPSTNTWRPFLRYSLLVSASLPMTTILCHSTRPWRFPSLSTYGSSVATEKFTNGGPVGV